MKRLLTVAILLLFVVTIPVEAQEKYSNTLNLGLGVSGYSAHYKRYNKTIPVISINYELGVAKNFTLAPFIALYTFEDQYYWGNKNNPDQYYHYSETVIPIGVKGTYYFDDLLKANSLWDFYLGASLGFAIVNSRWDDGYYGDKDYYHNNSNVFLHLHIGAEYHFTKRLGVFLDLSSSVSSIGLAVHGK
jgi:hypothetical protein